MNGYNMKQVIRGELTEQIRRSICDDVIFEAVGNAIRKMDLSDMICEAVETCVAENIELVIESMVQEVVDEVVEDEVVSIFEDM